MITNKWTRLTNEEKLYISQNSKNMYMTEIADRLSISHTKVYNYINRAKLPQKKSQPRSKGKVVQVNFSVKKEKIRAI